MTDELKLRFLIVDDEQSIRRLCITVGQGLGYICAEAETAEAALESLETSAPDLVVTDLKLPSLSGVELLTKIKELLPRAEVAIMTGHGSVETAVDAMRQGAYDYIEKPFRVERLRQLLQRMAEKVRLVTENQFLRERVNTVTDLDGIVGTSAKIQDVLRMISRLKETRTPVLITGESGTGKELVARAIHFPRPARGNAFRRRGLRLARSHPDGKRTLRPRERLVHRRAENPRPASSRPPTAARFFSMKSASFRWNCKPSSCASCRKKKSVRSAAMKKFRWTSA